MAEKVKWSMVRGDTLAFKVEIESDDTPTDLDGIAFSCKADTSSDEYVFKKTLGDGVTREAAGQYRVRVAPEDTAEIDPGTYAIDLQLKVNNDVATPILGTLKVLQDVTTEEQDGNYSA